MTTWGQLRVQFEPAISERSVETNWVPSRSRSVVARTSLPFISTAVLGPVMRNYMGHWVSYALIAPNLDGHWEDYASSVAKQKSIQLGMRGDSMIGEILRTGDVS